MARAQEQDLELSVECSTCGASPRQLCHVRDVPTSLYYGRRDGLLYIHNARKARYRLLHQAAVAS